MKFVLTLNKGYEMARNKIFWMDPLCGEQGLFYDKLLMSYIKQDE